MNDYWTNRFTQLWAASTGRGVKICDLLSGSVLEGLDEYDGDFMKVRYVASRTFEGWIYRAHAEEITHTLPHNVVDMGGSQTPSQQDAAQYIIYIGNIQYNLCGEMCMASIFGDGIIAFRQTFLNLWRSKATSVFNRVFYGGKSRTTGVADLKSMASCYPCETMSVRDAFLDPYSNTLLLSPRRMSSLTDAGWRIIMGVRIEGAKGELRPSGIPHWVVARDVLPTGVNRARLTIYNPFGNQDEEYSWREFTQSVGAPYGLLVRPT